MINTSKLHELHAIRGWAALLVVIAHSKYPFWSGGVAYLEKFPRSTWGLLDYLVFGINMLSSVGGIFVICFFVLSGFFIARSLKTNRNVFFFYSHRLIRIYIPVLGSLMAAYFLMEMAHYLNEPLFSLSNTGRTYNDSIVIAYNHDLSWQSFISTLYFNPSDGFGFFGFNSPLWSLFCEMIFYVSIPFMTRKFLFISVAILLHIVSLFISYEFVSMASYTHYALYFAMGYFLYEILSSQYADKVKNIVLKNTNLIVISSFVFLFLSIALGLFHFEKFKDDMAMLSTILFMLWILLGKKTSMFVWAKRIVVNRASKFLGKISFSLYLTHLPLMLLLYSLLNIFSGEIVYYNSIYWLTLFFTIPFSYVFFRVFEQPSMTLLKWHKSLYLVNPEKGKSGLVDKTS